MGLAEQHTPVGATERRRFPKRGLINAGKHRRVCGPAGCRKIVVTALQMFAVGDPSDDAQEILVILTAYTNAQVALGL